MESKYASKFVNYGRPFVLRRVVDTMSGDEFESFGSNGGYWSTKTSKRGGIVTYGKLHSSSLMTFHGPRMVRKKQEKFLAEEKEEKNEDIRRSPTSTVANRRRGGASASPIGKPTVHD